MSTNNFVGGGAPGGEAQNVVSNGNGSMPGPFSPAGPDVGIDAMLKPLLDGSFANGNSMPGAHSVPGARPNQQGRVGTAPLPAPGTQPLPGGQRPAIPVPPALIQALVQRIQAGFPQNVSLEKTPEIEQMLAGRFMAALSQVPGPIPQGGQEALF